MTAEWWNDGGRQGRVSGLVGAPYVVGGSKSVGDDQIHML